MNLKPCPVCGAKTIEEYGPSVKKVRPTEKNKYYYMIQCTKCNNKTGLFKREEEAIGAWNQKAVEIMKDKGIILNPCPFCGSVCVEVETLPDTTYAVMCQECGARGGRKWNKEDAIKVWNTRTREEEKS